MTAQLSRLAAVHAHKPPLAGDVARRAFDGAAGIARATSMAEVEAAFRPAITALGFENFVSVEVRGRDLRLIDGRPHVHWYPRLLERGYQWQDAPFVIAREGTGSLFYSDVENQRDLSPIEQQIAGERAEHGIHDGFASAVHSPGGIVHVVAMTAAALDPRDPDVRAAAHILSTYYGLATRRLAAPSEPHRTMLTARQIDCLCWVREGKSATDIAEILGISAHTVHEHVAQACQRLGVRTRVQAVAMAMTLRLIDP